MKIENALTVMQAAAVKAGEMLMKTRAGVKRLESRKDFLTDADLKSEKIILSELSRAYPDIPSLSEEKGGDERREGYLWVVDPVDGTVNYFLGLENWGISIALVKDGESVAGVIYLPVSRQLFVVSQRTRAKMRVGAGRWKDLRVSDDGKLADTQIWTGWCKEKHGGADHETCVEMLRKLDRRCLYPQIRNCATSDSLNVALGKIAGLAFYRIEPFDVAAAGLIIRRAGGTVTEIDGNAWVPFSESFVASNGKVHDELLRAIA